jgi:hypothetical protein
MSLAGFARFERLFDKITPAYLLALGLSISAAFAHQVVGVI